jgi:hypothetical protein
VDAEALVPLFKLVTGKLPTTWVDKFTPLKVPASVIVPVEVIGPPVKLMPFTVPAVATEVTVPPPLPAPIAVLKSPAFNAETVLSAFILGNVIALGLGNLT